MARKCKSYEELELSDDFMFAKVMQNKALCKELLELIMDFPIADIVYLEEQKTLDVAANAKSVRMDVYAADENQTIYDIEMQTGKKKHLPKRSRYYQGIIDIDETDKGIEYQSLNKSYVIFICTFDPFDAGRHIYSFENRCIQDLNLELGDGTGKIFLSAVGRQNDVSAEMKAFLEYLSKKTIETDFVHRLDREVQRVRDNQKWRKEYMQRQSDWIEDREEAKEEGLAEGIEAGKLEMLNRFIKGMKAKNISETEIKNNLMDIFALPEEEAENLLQGGKKQ